MRSGVGICLQTKWWQTSGPMHKRNRFYSAYKMYLLVISIALSMMLPLQVLFLKDDFIITRDSEVIMFSPCVFVCLCVCVYVSHDVFPDDLTMKDWCHTNNTLQVHCWGCLVVQVIFHALMTSLMTLQEHKVGQIWKLKHLREYFGYSVDQKLKMSDMLMAIFLVYSTSGTTSGKKVCRELKMAAILKMFNY